MNWSELWGTDMFHVVAFLDRSSCFLFCTGCCQLHHKVSTYQTRSRHYLVTNVYAFDGQAIVAGLHLDPLQLQQ